MRSRHRRHVAALLLGAGLLAGCTTSEATTQPDGTPSAGSSPAPTTTAPSAAAWVPATLPTDRARQSPGVIAAGGGDAVYNYGPTVLAEGGRYRMWWCSQLGIAAPPGDDILLAESASIDGPFGTAAPVFSGSATGFDAMHTCDPSVIKVGGIYYLYYTGAPAGDHAHGNAIGLATSTDGRAWTRANGGHPIITPARQVSNHNVYGAGQPAALYLDGWFYLMFTDTSGREVDHNGAGQFVLRSTDPAFRTGLQTLTDGGFRDTSTTTDRLRSVVDAFSADWMWVDALAAFAIAHETADGTTLTFWDKDFRGQHYQPLVVRGPWQEGPGLVRRADGHAPTRVDDPCGQVSVDLVRATRDEAAPTDLMHFGLDIVGIDACRDAGRALQALDGFAMPSPQRTIDLVVGGVLVRIDRRSVAEKLAIRILEQRIPALDSVPVAARLTPGLPARRTQGRGIGLVLDHRLWRISSPVIAQLNSSPILDVSPSTWDIYERGVDLVAPPR